MKNFPLPSFFKIRLVALLVGFFVVCFLLGAAKHVFAAYPGDCQTLVWLGKSAGFTTYTQPAPGESFVGDGYGTVDYATGTFGTLPGHYETNPTTKYGPIGSRYVYIMWWQDDGYGWKTKTGQQVSGWQSGAGKAMLESVPYGAVSELPVEGCAGLPSCDDERNVLAAQCGGDSNIMNWDDQACTGECKPDCTEEYANLVTACGGRQYIDWFDDETCLGECVTCEDVQEYCESQGFNTSDPAVFQCTDSGWIEPADEGGNFGQYWHTGIDADETCGFDSGFDPDNPGPDDPPKDPPPSDPPADRPCFELEADCIARCNGKVKNFSCTEGETYNCQCVDDTGTPDPTPNPTPPPDTPPDPGDDAPPGTPGDSPGTPDGTNDNELLGKISTNLKGIADNTNRIGDINQAEFNKLNATATDIKNAIGNGNTMLGQIEAAQNKGNEHLKDIAKDIGKIENNTDGIEDLLGDIKDIFDEDFTEIGSGNPTEAYSPTEEEFNIGERFDTFISRIRNTGVFALPNDFFNAPPSGGSPVFTFEFGSYGTRTVDLADMSQPLLILRTIVLIAFCFVCLRVVILKR